MDDTNKNKTNNMQSKKTNQNDGEIKHLAKYFLTGQQIWKRSNTAKSKKILTLTCHYWDTYMNPSKGKKW